MRCADLYELYKKAVFLAKPRFFLIILYHGKACLSIVFWKNVLFLFVLCCFVFETTSKKSRKRSRKPHPICLLYKGGTIQYWDKILEIKQKNHENKVRKKIFVFVVFVKDRKNA